MPLSPDQATFISRLTLPTLKNEHEITLKVIRAIPNSQGDYRPDNISRTASDLIWHTVAAEIAFLNAVASGAFNQDPGTRPADIAQTADWYASRFASNLERLKTLSGEDLLKVLDFRGVFQLPAFAYLNFALHHSIHHRGQLSMYFRPLGVCVPSIYGESYDDAAKRTNT